MCSCPLFSGLEVVVVLREFQRLGDFVLPDEQVGVAKIPLRFPGVFGGRVSLPAD